MATEGDAFYMIKEVLKKHFFTFVLIAVILFGIFIRIKCFLINPSFWHDECGIAWNIKFKSSLGLLGHLRFLQVAPPGFLILTKLLTKAFGFSEMVFRFIPLLTGCLSVVLFYFLSVKALNKNSSILLSVLFFAINERLINYSFEFKPYGVDVFFTIIGLLFFINLDLEKLSLKKALIYGFLIALAPWFSFTSIFIIAGGFLILLLKNIKTDWIKKLSLMLPIIISGLIYLIFCAMGNQDVGKMETGWQSSFVTLNPFHFLSLFIESIRYLFPSIPLLLFAFILFIWGFTALAKEKSTYFKVATASLAAFLVASLFHVYPFSDRVILFLIPIYILFMTKPIDLISSSKKAKSLVIILLSILAFYMQIIVIYQYAKAKVVSRREYAGETMEFMAKNIKPNDIILVNNSSSPEFDYYSSFYNLKNKTIVDNNVANFSEKTYLNFLDSLAPGNYWFYMPYESFRRRVFAYIIPWAKKHKILFQYKNQKSILMYIQIK